MDGWMRGRGRGREGGSEGREALGRATQSRLQMWRQQQCGCFGPHQAALGVSPAHVPAPPVNQPEQASGSKLQARGGPAATKPLRPDPQKQSCQRQTDADEPAAPTEACNSLSRPPACAMEAAPSYKNLVRRTRLPLPPSSSLRAPSFAFNKYLAASQTCVLLDQKHTSVGKSALLTLLSTPARGLRENDIV